MFPVYKDRPLLMGILNVTPDSFSDGGTYGSASAAVTAAKVMMGEGADLIDVGGESTRPGSEPIELQEELRRVIPVVEELCDAGFAVSVDTSKSAVAKEALKLGAAMVNDVTALRDPEMASVCASFGCRVCLMHMQGRPKTMQDDPTYADVVEEVREFLLAKAKGAEALGVKSEHIWIDPGIGFGKSVKHNLLIIKSIARLTGAGYPVLLGVSRKGFLGKVMGGELSLPVDQRLEGTLATHVYGQLAGVQMLRTHDVREARRSIDMVSAIQTV